MKKVSLEIEKDVKPVWNTEWFEENQLVKIKIQKFKRKTGKWLCTILKKPEYIIMSLDKIGSLVWKKCNGEKNIKEMITEISKEIGEDFEKENMRKRIFLFLHILHRRDLIILQK